MVTHPQDVLSVSSKKTIHNRVNFFLVILGWFGLAFRFIFHIVEILFLKNLSIFHILFINFLSLISLLSVFIDLDPIGVGFESLERFRFI